jgi:hypothetical protein
MVLATHAVVDVSMLQLAASRLPSQQRRIFLLHQPLVRSITDAQQQSTGST